MDNNLLRDKSFASYVEPVIFRVNKVSHPCFIDILLDCVREMCGKGTYNMYCDLWHKIILGI